MGSVPAVSSLRQPTFPGGRERRPAMCTTSSSLLSNHRHPVPSEPSMLQPGARMWRRLHRVPAVTVFHHAGNQLHSKSSSERMECARLETRTTGHAHMSADAVPIHFVPPATTTARTRLPASVRSPLPQVSRQTDDSEIRSRQTVADTSAAVQSAAARSTVHVSCYRVKEVDRSHSVQIRVSRSVHSIDYEIQRVTVYKLCIIKI